MSIKKENIVVIALKNINKKVKDYKKGKDRSNITHNLFGVRRAISLPDRSQEIAEKENGCHYNYK